MTVDGSAQNRLVLWVGRPPFGPRSGIQFGNDMREWRRYEPTITYHLDLTYPSSKITIPTRCWRRGRHREAHRLAP